MFVPDPDLWLHHPGLWPVGTAVLLHHPISGFASSRYGHRAWQRRHRAARLRYLGGRHLPEKLERRLDRLESDRAD